MLFAYCNRSAASDVILDSSNDNISTDSDSLIPDIEGVITPKAYNTNVVSPDNYDDLLPTNNIYNSLIFSGTKKFESFIADINSDKMYYSKDMISNIGFKQMSLYYYLIPKSYIIPEFDNYLTVDVVISSLRDDIVTKGYFYTSGTYSQLIYPDSVFFNFSTSGYDVVDTDYTDYKVCLLVVDVPYLPLTTDYNNDIYNSSFYISEIIFNGLSGANSAQFDNKFFLGHICDVFTYNSSFVSPKNNTAYLSVFNTSGAYLNEKNIDVNNDLRIYSSVQFNNNTLLCNSLPNDYKYVYNEGEFIYTSFQCDSANFNLQYFMLGQGSFFDFIEMAFDENFDSFVNAIINKDFEFLNINMPFPYYGFFQQIRTNRNGVNIGSGFSIFYSYPFIYTLNPSVDSNQFGNLSYSDVNAQKYYIEPQDWKDFGAHFNNIIVWLCFEMPLLSIITKPIYLFLNGFLEIWVQIALPLATALGLIGGALIFYLIYLFISKLLFNKSPD